MQTENYKAQYPNFGSLTFSTTPAGTKTAEIAGLFDKIMGLVESHAVSPEVGRGAIIALQSAWGNVYVALNGKVGNA